MFKRQEKVDQILEMSVYWLHLELLCLLVILLLRYLLTDRQNRLQHHPQSSSYHSETFNIIKSFIKIKKKV